MFATFLASLILALLAFFSPRPAPRQEQQLTTIENFPDPRYPLEITAVKWRGQTVSMTGIGFLADDNWMDDISVVVKNVSNEDIDGVMVWVDFPANSPEEVPPPPGLTLHTGKRYDAISNGRGGQPLSLPPGESVEVRQSDRDRTSPNEHFVQQNLPTSILHKVRVWPRYASFGPNRYWKDMTYFVRDSTNPERFINPAYHERLEKEKTSRLSAPPLPVSSVSASLAVTAPQQQPTSVIALTNYKGSPIQITAVKYKGQPVSMTGETFDAAEGWLEDISVEVKNISTEPISGLTILVEFPLSDPTGTSPLPGLILPAGKRYEYDREGGSGNLLLAPGESVEVSLPESSKLSYAGVVRHQS
jgi:hypothetical protein